MHLVHNQRRNRRPLKGDPSRTGGIRRRFIADLRRRYRVLKRRIFELIVTEDAFGLNRQRAFNEEQSDERQTQCIQNKGTSARVRPRASHGHSAHDPDRLRDCGDSLTLLGQEQGDGHTTQDEAKRTGQGDLRRGISRGARMRRSSDGSSERGGYCTYTTGWVLNQRFAFQTTPEQLRLFNEWLSDQIQTEVIGTTIEEVESAYWTQYVRESYEKGAGRAFNDTRRAALAATPEDVAAFGGSRDEFLRSSFGRAVAPEKVKLLAGRVFTDLKGINQALSTQISRTLTDGLAQGRNPREIARTATDLVDKIGRGRAELMARTECLPGDTLVDGAVVRAVFRRPYSGDMVEVVTRSGRKFSATPNHPMLTQDGWVAAGKLNESHKLVCNNRKEHASPSGDEHVERRPTTLREIFDSLSAVSTRERVACGKPDFHGDGMEGQVDILRPDGELRVGRFSSIGEPLAQQVFSPAGQARSSFCPTCSRLLSINEQPCACGSPQRDSGLYQPPLDHRPVDAEILGNGANGLAAIVPRDDGLNVDIGSVLVTDPAPLPGELLAVGVGSCDRLLPQDLPDLPLMGPDVGSDFPLSEPGQVELDNVLSVRIRPFSGHVYNLQTPFGYYTIDSLYTGNTIRAHAEAQLDAMEELGVTEVGVMVEWSTAGDDRVCFPAGTLVATEDGQTPIEEVTIGTKVHTRAGLRDVVDTSVQSYAGELVAMDVMSKPEPGLIDDFSRIVTTVDHPFYRPGIADDLPGEWARAGILCSGVKLLSLSKVPVYVREICTFTLQDSLAVYDLSVDADPEFYANGILVHNCPLCQPLEGVILKIEEARGLIPRHPACRCTYIPANVGEPRGEKTLVHFTDPQTGEVVSKRVGQVRGQKGVKRAFDRSIRAEGKRSLKAQKRLSPWQGADTSIKAKRPRGLTDKRTRPGGKQPVRGDKALVDDHKARLDELKEKPAAELTRKEVKEFTGDVEKLPDRLQEKVVTPKAKASLKRKAETPKRPAAKKAAPKRKKAKAKKAKPSPAEQTRKLEQQLAEQKAKRTVAEKELADIRRVVEKQRPAAERALRDAAEVKRLKKEIAAAERRFKRIDRAADKAADQEKDRIARIVEEKLRARRAGR